MYGGGSGASWHANPRTPFHVKAGFQPRPPHPFRFMLAEERCKYCGKSLTSLEIFEQCSCVVGKTVEQLEEDLRKRLAREIPLWGTDGD
jgi:hypothetical protein